ncbi:MAG: hypothetical protein ACOYXN_07155 [Acidobacteriota bacterium]
MNWSDHDWGAHLPILRAPYLVSPAPAKILARTLLALLLSAGSLPWTCREPVREASWDRPALSVNVPGSEGILQVNLSRPARLKIWIVGPDGRRVRSLADGIAYPSGTLRLPWDCRDAEGRPVPAEAYTVSIHENQGREWVPVFEPNAENHGRRVEVEPLQWDAGTGLLTLSISRPARIRVWVVCGDDGLILDNLMDMEPVGRGLLSLRWPGLDSLAGEWPSWVSPSFHFKAIALPECSLVVQGRGLESYLEASERYPLSSDSLPKIYEDSSPLYRNDLAGQKELRFESELRQGLIGVLPKRASLREFKTGSPDVRVFFADQSWVQVELSPSKEEEGTYEARLPSGVSGRGAVLAAVVSTDRDQYGHSLFPRERRKRPI